MRRLVVVNASSPGAGKSTLAAAVVAEPTARGAAASWHKCFVQLIGRMTVAPVDLANRLRAVFRAEPLAGWRQLKAIGDETLDLVETRMPDLDATNLFAGHPEVSLAWAKKRWNVHQPDTLLEAIGASGQE